MCVVCVDTIDYINMSEIDVHIIDENNSICDVLTFHLIEAVKNVWIFTVLELMPVCISCETKFQTRMHTRKKEIKK